MRSMFICSSPSGIDLGLAEKANSNNYKRQGVAALIFFLTLFSPARALCISTLLLCQAVFFLSHVQGVRSCRKKSSFLVLGHFYAVLLVEAFNKVGRRI